MKHLILCEGKTDAILLSYYLQATNQWVFTKKQPKDLTIQVDDINGESLNWYQRGEDSLLICGVGGKDKFHKFFREKIQDPQVKSDAVSKIAVIMDRDQDSESDLLRKVDRDFYPLIQKPLLNKWCPCSYRNGYGEEKSFGFLLIVIPTDKEGAMEALILDAICEDQENKIIVDLCRDHVDHVQPFAWRYRSKNRLKSKAYLGVTWAIQYPEKIFSLIDEQMRSIRWGDSAVLKECFKQLSDL